MEKTYYLGKCDYNNSGEKNARAYISLSLSDDGRFSASGEIQNPRGQVVSGGQNLEELLKLFPESYNLRQTVKIWRRWHLNDLRANCEHQIGEAWLKETIPQEVISEIERLMMGNGMQAEPSELEQWIKETGLTASYNRVPSNPHNKEWTEADHYRLTIARGEKAKDKPSLVVYYSQGWGIQERPKLLTVLQCLSDDFLSIWNYSKFEEWAENLGYDSDSRKAEKAFNTINEQLKKFNELLSGTEWAKFVNILKA